MSEQAGGEGGHEAKDDPWIGTVTSVCAFLAGFSLAAVVVIASAPDNFRWPGTAALALTIGSVLLVGAAQGSRNGAFYYENFKKNWRVAIWVLYHAGLIALAVGLGAALAPKDGVGGQQVLRWVAACVAFAAAAGEAVNALITIFKRNYW